MITDDEILRLRGMSDDELRIELGHAIRSQSGRRLRAKPPSAKQLIAEANDWIIEKNNELKAAICSNERIRAIVVSEPGATEKLIRVVADVVTALVFFVPAATVAEILVRDGIPEYCKPMWNQDS